jgi:nucleoside phosphorylase/CheY-like chemotaxis protein
VLKVLIVDDNVAKAGKLVSLLVACGIERGEIEVVVSAISARQRLCAVRYDLLVVDLLLPQREEDAPTVECAIALIEEIGERDVYFKPKHVVGFTAYPEAEVRATEAFRHRLWTIVQFDPTTSEWESQFRNVADYLLRLGNEPTSAAYNVDVCIVSGLQLEIHAVHSLAWNWSDPEPLDDMTFVRQGTFSSNGSTKRVVTASCRRMGSVAAALLTSKLIERFRPRFVAMPGICAGVKGKINIGDTVLMDPVWEWPSGKLAEEGDGGTYLQPAPHQIALSEFVVARAEQLREDRGLWRRVAELGKSEGLIHSVGLHIGPGASGSAVVTDSATMDAIRTQHRKLLAVEMEAYGVYASARSSSTPRPTALAMKTVCDFADDEKVDKWQRVAARISSVVLGAFLERYLDEMTALAGTQ